MTRCILPILPVLVILLCFTSIAYVTHVKLSSAYAIPLYGVEPTSAVDGNGTIYVAWMGLRFLNSTRYFDEGAQFESEILFSRSTDGGVSFTQPVAVSVGEGNIDPSLAIKPDGTILISYLDGDRNVVLAESSDLGVSFTRRTVMQPDGVDGFDRPWMSVSSSGIIYLIWRSPDGVFWSKSADGRGFSTHVLVNGTFFPTGLSVDKGGSVHAALLGWPKNITRPYVPPNKVLYARMPNNTRRFQVTRVGWIEVPYNFGSFAHRIFRPGPALAVNGPSVFLAYVTGNGHSLMLIRSMDGGMTWSKPLTLRLAAGYMEMPWMAVRKDNLVMAWGENTAGSWNIYYSSYRITDNSLLPLTDPVKVNMQKGFSANVLNWHGDFLSVNVTPKGSVVVAWGGGGDLDVNVGLGHVYVAVVAESELHENRLT